jgi:hypothetical protein
VTLASTSAAQLQPGSSILPNISQGWPRILSSLKTLLETGDVLPVG